MARIAGWIAHVLDAPGDEARIRSVRDQVRELCRAHPLYPELTARDTA
jgi:glycine/serine hydroxymethyltransferase